MSITLIDTHAHLDYDHLYDQLDDVIIRASEAGVKHIISIGVKLSTSHRPKEIAERYENIWCSVGIHPHEAENEPEACNIEAIMKAADHPKVVAIGEAGLDYFYDHAPRQLQADSLRAQIQVARQLNLPIIIHARDADDDMAAILEDEYQKGAYKGVLHCFSSGASLAERALAIGFYISFSGIVTFKSATNIQQIAKMAPEDRILVETDAPYLAPVPKRGQKNEPAFTRYTAQFVADLRGITLDRLAMVTTANAQTLFSKMGMPNG
ncbi:MAG: TatD family hydrolase [Candidatus Puniceispirillaceae bacterium]